MTADPRADEAPSLWRAALALRFRVLKRRYGSPFEAVLLLVVCLLSGWIAGKAATKVEPALLVASGSAGIAVAFLLVVRAAWHLLYRSKELVLLLTQGLTVDLLVRLRLLELALGAGLLTLPVLAGARGVFRATSGAEPAPGLWLSVLLIGPLLAGVGLLGAWLLAGLPRAARAPLASLPLLGLAGAAALEPGLLRVALLGRWAPAPLLGRLARGELEPLALLGALALTAAILAFVLVGRGHGARLDAAAPRDAGRVRFGGVPRLTRALLPAPWGALVGRDLILVLRGGAPRAWLILGGLPFTIALVPAFASDATLLPWQLRFAALLLIGILASASGFLFGVDLPLTRRPRLVLERTQPLRAWQVLLARWSCALGYGLLLALAAALFVARVPRPELAAEALTVGLAGALQVAIVTHHAVTFGLRGEAESNPAEASGYPFNGGVVVLGFALLLVFHPLTALVYPLLWAGFTKQALVIWERAEVADLPEAAA